MFRLMNLSPYGHMEMSQLVTMLVEARNIEEQVDILHFLVVTYGVDYTIHVKQVIYPLNFSRKFIGHILIDFVILVG